VLYRRERAVMLEPRDKGIVLWTLRYGDEVRDAAAYFDDIDGDRPDAKALALVRKLIDKRTAAWDPKMVEDPVQDRLLEIIEARKKKQKPAKAAGRELEPEDTPNNVVSILDALRKSVESEKSGGRKAGRR
jgi:DNA end-binding protein Ku